MIFDRARISRAALLLLFLSTLIFPVACSPREQARGQRWKNKAEAYMEGRPLRAREDWLPKENAGEEEELVELAPVSFREVLDGLPAPQSWRRLQNGMVLKFREAQLEGDWRKEIQYRLWHLFFIYLNDSNKYSVKRWSKAVERLEKRLEAIGKKVADNPAEKQALARIRFELKNADAAARLYFGQGDRSVEVEGFREQLAVLLPPERARIAELAGGEAKLAELEVFAKKSRDRKSGPGDKKQEALRLDYENLLKHPVAKEYFERQPGQAGALKVVEVPDLAAVLGEAPARELLLKVLASPSIVKTGRDNKTEELARDLALQNMGKVAAPQWILAAGPEGAELFDALRKRFPERTDRELEKLRQRAALDAVLWKAAKGTPGEALALVAKDREIAALFEKGKGPWNLNARIEELAEAGYGPQMLLFVEKLLEANPEANVWKAYSVLSSQQMKKEAELELALRSEKRTDISPALRAALVAKRAQALVLSGKMEEGAALMKENISRPGTVPAEEVRRYYRALQLAELGQLAQRSEWIETGLAAAEQCLAGIPVEALGYHDYEQLSDFYLKLGRSAEAERLLKTAWEKSAATNDQERGRYLLEALLAVYVAEDRNEEAIALLENSPGWNRSDLADMLQDEVGYPPAPVGYWVSWALARLARTDEAAAVARGQIRVSPDKDGGYAILSQLEGVKALPYLEEIKNIFPLEEKPLLWKARILERAGRLDEAEAAAYEALVLDPLGAQGGSHEAGVFAILAEVERKRGKAERAAPFEQVIKAVEITEDGREAGTLGLETLALSKYEEALRLFKDSYRAEALLARQLLQAGREQEALPHLQRAFELILSHSGRTENQRLEFEELVDTVPAQKVAEQVFGRELRKKKDQTQASYFMGRLREKQHRFREAFDCYIRTVVRDPQHVDAWSRLRILRSEVEIDPRVMDRIQISLLKLDPAGRYSSTDLSEVNDLPKLLGLIGMTNQMLATVPEPEAVFELRASEEALRREQPERVPEDVFSGERSFASVLLRHAVVRDLKGALDALKVEPRAVMTFEMEE